MVLTEAAPIAALAQGGEIVASLGTLDEVKMPHTLGNQRSVQLKGLAEPSQIVTISWR